MNHKVLVIEQLYRVKYLRKFSEKVWEVEILENCVFSLKFNILFYHYIKRKLWDIKQLSDPYFRQSDKYY